MIGLLLLALPFVEIYLFVLIGRAYGWLAPLGIIAGSILVGIWLLQSAGLRAMAGFQRAVMTGQKPTRPLLYSAMSMVAAVLFIIPGVITDGLALILVLPFTRALLASRVEAWLTRRLQKGGGFMSFGVDVIDVDENGMPRPPADAGEDAPPPELGVGGKIIDVDEAPPEVVTARGFTREEIQKILLEHRYLSKADAVCKKWKISRSMLRKWKAAHGSAQGGLRELVIVALHGAAVDDPADLVGWLDYQDHAVYSTREVRRALDALVSEGIALKRGSTWRYDPRHSRRGRSFVF